ncbi:hypothetical protein [Bacillus salipaludis]|nr:hypothetical protein [Bacillus salipaludis]MDQ6600627.1 hypothetical protein [Bacillus salipaludis]
MNKKKFTSWSVSFASLAFVAGMISYLGINKDTINKTTATTQAQVTTQSPTQSGSSSITYELPNRNRISDSKQSNTQSVSQDQSFSQHGGFDTTTGGT